MKRMQPTAWFWIVAAAVLAVALFTVSNVHGQNAGSSAVFEGRPAMAGAQGGLGPNAGPPQGGVGPQSPADQGAGIGNVRRPDAMSPMIPRDPGPVPRDPGPLPRDPGVDRSLGNTGEVQPQRDRGEVVKREREGHGLQQQGDTTERGKRAGKRTIERARRGLSGVDS